MKLLVNVAICVFAAQACFAQIEGDVLTSAFIAAGSVLPASPIEGQITENLREIILNETALYIERIVNDLERQLNVQSHLQVTVLRLGVENLNYQIEQLPVDAAPDSLDLALQFINQKIVEAFNLIPNTLGGNAITKPKMPFNKEKKPSYKSFFSSGNKPGTVHTLPVLMNNLAKVLETDLSALYKFQKKLLSAGYEGVGTAYAVLQEEFRTLAINEYIVPGLQSIVLDVQAKAEIAEAHVNAVTWSKFLALSEQLAVVVANTKDDETTTEATTEATTQANEEETTEAKEEVTTEANGEETTEETAEEATEENVE